MPVMTQAEKAGYDQAVITLPSKLSKDGTEPMEGNLVLANHRITKVGEGIDPQDVTNLGQVEAKFALGAIPASHAVVGEASQISDIWKVGSVAPLPEDLDAVGSMVVDVVGRRLYFLDHLDSIFEIGNEILPGVKDFAEVDLVWASTYAYSLSACTNDVYAYYGADNSTLDILTEVATQTVVARFSKPGGNLSGAYTSKMNATHLFIGNSPGSIVPRVHIYALADLLSDPLNAVPVVVTSDLIAPTSSFGQVIEISDNYLYVSDTSRQCTDPTYSGNVQVYTLDGTYVRTIFADEVALQIPGRPAVPTTSFGISMTVDADDARLMVGSLGGSVVAVLDETASVLVGIYSQTYVNGDHGTAVAMTADSYIVSAPGSGEGDVLIYDDQGAEVAYLRKPGQTSDRFGVSMQIVGDVLVVSAFSLLNSDTASLTYYKTTELVLGLVPSYSNSYAMYNLGVIMGGGTSHLAITGVNGPVIGMVEYSDTLSNADMLGRKPVSHFATAFSVQTREPYLGSPLDTVKALFSDINGKRSWVSTVQSVTSVTPGASSISNMISLTQDEYDEISITDANCLYVIVG